MVRKFIVIQITIWNIDGAPVTVDYNDIPLYHLQFCSVQLIDFILDQPSVSDL